MSQPPTPEDPELIHGWADAPVSGDRIDLHEGPIVAGDREGARVEVTETGLRAYDSTGTETASIAGDGGEFVGGSFRTSDNQAGQVTLSDTALANPYTNGFDPGIRVEPADSSGYSKLPGIGPSDDNMLISGGQGTSGNFTNVILSPISAAMQWRDGDAWAFTSTSQDAVYSQARAANGNHGEIQAAPTNTILRTTQAGGGGGSIQTTLGGATVQLGDTNGAVSSVHTDATEAYLYTRAGGVSRYLAVDADGVWVKTNRGGTWRHYNLEETAQDSGWNDITLASGLTGGWSPAWRNKGGVIYLRGRVTRTDGNWAPGWNVLANVTPEARPSSHIQRAGAARGVGHNYLEVTTGGIFQAWFETETPGSTTVELSPMFYPLG